MPTSNFRGVGRLLLCLVLSFRLPAADLVLTNAHIWTGVPERPWAQAIAIEGNRIAAVSTNDGIQSFITKKTKVIELGDKLVIPGFNDAHIHFLSGSLGLAEVDLTGACSLPEMQRRIADYARKHPREPWILGSGWEYSCFPESRLPRKEDLDAAVADRPAFLSAYDGHTGWANSKALQVAGIGKNYTYSGFGEVVLDPQTGEPTGCLKEGAQSLVRRLAPPPTREAKLAALEQGLQLAASLGITSMQNASGDPETLALFEELERQSKLTVRTSLAFSMSPPFQATDLLRFRELSRRYRSSMLRAGAVKFMLDGVIESHTAAMLAPYSDRPGLSGRLAWTQEEFQDAVTRVDAAGLQIYTHAIGDRAVRAALDAYQHALQVNGPHDARYRIEHIETISPEDLPRFARLGVLASMEPIHADPATSEVWSRAVGPERLRSLERAGARLVFSSDWPACISLNPIHGLHIAVNRQTPDGKPPGGWIPEQRVSLETALRAYTSAGAYASFEEDEKGVLRKGMLADMVVLSRDLFRIPPSEIATAKVVLTIFDGRILYQPSGS
jgi:predicted amidohydrolase YtcJ